MQQQTVTKLKFHFRFERDSFPSPSRSRSHCSALAKAETAFQPQQIHHRRGGLLFSLSLSFFTATPPSLLKWTLLIRAKNHRQIHRKTTRFCFEKAQISSKGCPESQTSFPLSSSSNNASNLARTKPRRRKPTPIHSNNNHHHHHNNNNQRDRPFFRRLHRSEEHCPTCSVSSTTLFFLRHPHPLRRTPPSDPSPATAVL